MQPAGRGTQWRPPQRRTNQPGSTQFLADDSQRVFDRSANDDRRTVLIVVEDWNPHPLAQFLLDVEAFRCFDVFEIDAAESGFQSRDRVDQQVRVGLRNLDVEYVDTREFFEQTRLPLHHRFASEWPDVAQTEYRGAIGDDCDQVGTRRKRLRFPWIRNDGVTGRSYRRVSRPAPGRAD